MNANIPVLPLAAGTLARACASLLVLVTYWFKEWARLRRHRRQAGKLAGLDRRMLADIGITRADLRDALSEPFWEDQTALLAERAIERRMNRAVARSQVKSIARPAVENGFSRPATDRPARHAV